MRSNYKKIGKFVQQIKNKNNANNRTVEHLRGINITKEFMPSVANVTGTDLSVYKVVEKNQFSYNPMHVGRDEILPISMLAHEDSVIVSPAYVVFEIVDTNELLPEYLMMWCRRSEFDRNAWFTTDSSVRGGFNWEDFCDLELPVPSIEKQKELVKEYHTITDRIKLNEQLNQKLEDTAKSIYKEWFVNFEFPNENGKPYKSNAGEMFYSEELDMEIPIWWEMKGLKDVCTVLSRGITPEYTEDEGIIVINQKCVRNNSIDLSLSRKHNVDSKKIPEEKYLKKFDTLINSTGQGTLGRVGILKEVEKAMTVDTHITIIRAINTINSLFLSYSLSYKTDEIESLGEGSTGQTELRREDLGNLQILIPNNRLQELFSSHILKILNHLILLEKEHLFLISLKETLLSKIATLED